MVDKDIVRSFAGFLAPALTTAAGETWQVDTTLDNEYAATLAGPGQQRLFLDFQSSQGKVAIRGMFPRNGRGDFVRHKPCKIQVTRTRPIEAIAAEIKRRLLPGYVTELARVESRIAAEDLEDIERRAFASELTALSGGRLSETGASVDFVGFYGSIEVHSSTSGEFKVSGGPELLRALAELVGKLH